MSADTFVMSNGLITVRLEISEFSVRLLVLLAMLTTWLSPLSTRSDIYVQRCIDSQSEKKTDQGGLSGYDGGKK